MENVVATPQRTTLAKVEVFPTMSGIAKYHLQYTLLLAGVPLACGVILLMMISVFSKLNLYFLEANGLILDEQLRDAYFKTVEMEMFNVVGYLVLQVFVTAVVAYMVMRWATAPFVAAQKMVQTAIDNPNALKPANRLLSESPTFDRLIWMFCLRVKSGGPNQSDGPVRIYGTNFPFLIKFLVTFTILSVSTGYVLWIITGSIYTRIVNLALQLLQAKSATGHYFLAQQDILFDTLTLTITLALLCYLGLGIQISRYMGTMMFVISRSVHEDRFPITLRGGDLYSGLTNVMNKARAKIG